MKYTVVTYPDPRLKLQSTPVEKIDDELRELISDMFEIMHTHDGIGLAAVQIGVMKRLFVMEVKRNKRIVAINPEIVEFSKDTVVDSEGCLSLPGISAEVVRSKRVTLKYTDIDGNEKILNASGLLAVCIQHEFDHLDGKVFIDHLDAQSKLGVIEEYKNTNGL